MVAGDARRHAGEVVARGEGDVAHRAVAMLVAEGFHPVVIGKRDHIEVRGLTEDLAEFDVVLSEADVEQLRERTRFGVAAQTTQPIERVRA